MNIFKIVLSIILIVSAILIGSPISYNCEILSLVIVLVGIIFIIYNFFIRKEKIIDSKLDIFILVLCLTPIIPIIFNTYISLNDTITSLLKYISCFVIYILVKKLVQSDEKNKNFILNIIIISSLFLCIIGIDDMTTKFFSNILENIKIPYVFNIENRMFSSFRYANTFAVILAVSVLLILDRVNNRIGKKYELLYSGALFINLSCLILTYSRAVFCFLVLALFVYILLNRDKKIFTIYILGLNVVFSLIYVVFYNKINIWVITILMFIISSLFLKLLDKIYNKIEKISKKSYIILLSVSVIIIILAIVIGIRLTKPLTIFEENSSSSEVRYDIENIDSNKEYVLKFDINSKSVVQNIENYEICVREENKYYDSVENHEISFNNFDGIKEIKFTTSDETVRLVVFFRSTIDAAQQGLTVNSFTINGEEHPLSYWYLPVSIVEKIKSINIGNKSVWERGTYYLDSLKIIKDNWIWGLGANAWNYSYIEIQSYNYSAVEVHSYILQLILEYGFIALISFIIIMIIIFINFIKSIKNRKNFVIYLAIFLLIAHSAVDFDMSFFYIMVICFTLMGLTASKKSESKTNKTKIIFGLLILIFVVAEGIGIWNILNEKSIQNKEKDLYSSLDDTNKVIETLEEIRKQEKNNLYLDFLKELDYSSVSSKNLQYLYDELIDIPVTVNIEYNMQKNRVIEKIVSTSSNEEMNQKFAEIIIEQNEEICDMIENKDETRLTKGDKKRYLAEQENIIESILVEMDKKEMVNE